MKEIKRWMKRRKLDKKVKITLFAMVKKKHTNRECVTCEALYLDSPMVLYHVKKYVSKYSQYSLIII